MKTFRLTLSLIAIALAAPLAASPGAVRDFQLQPSPTPTPTPQVQGPVDLEGTPVAPRVINRPTPTPAPTAAPTAALSGGQTPAPNQTAPVRDGSRAPAPPREAPTARATGQATQSSSTAQQSVSPAAPAQTGGEQDTDGQTGPSEQRPSAALPNTAGQSAANPAVTSQDNESGWLGWLIIVGGLALLGFGGLLFWRRRQVAAETVPQIEPPLVRNTAPALGGKNSEIAPAEKLKDPTPPPVEFSAAKSKFQAKVAALSLSRSVMNATLVYHLELQNLGSGKIEDISVYADLVSAHGKAPVSEQLADDSSQLAFASFVAEVRARDAQEVKGEFRLPLSQIKTIAQGSAKLFVPLLRLRIEAESIDTIVQTFVVGVRPDGGKGKLLPFRLDEMAQTYRNIGLRQIG